MLFFTEKKTRQHQPINSLRAKSDYEKFEIAWMIKLSNEQKWWVGVFIPLEWLSQSKNQKQRKDKNRIIRWGSIKKILISVQNIYRRLSLISNEEKKQWETMFLRLL
jgi:hypothetical protein